MDYPIVVKVIGSMDRIHASLGQSRKNFSSGSKVLRLLKTLTLIRNDRLQNHSDLESFI